MAILPSDRLVNNIPDGFLAKSPIHGTGLFAVRDMTPGEIIGRLGGEIIPWADYFILGPEKFVDLEWNALTTMQLLVRQEKTKYCAINHSRYDYNLWLKRVGAIMANPTEIEVVVAKKVKSNDELLLNYLEEPLPDTYNKMHGWMYL